MSIFFRMFFQDQDGGEGDHNSGDGDAGDSGNTGPSNADIKASDLFQKVTGELAELQREKAERKAAEADAASKAETERLEKEGNWKEAKAKYEADALAKDERHAKELLSRDLKSDLHLANFKNAKFVKGAIADYDPKTSGTVAEYVASLVADTENAPFMKGATDANGNKIDPPPKVNVSGSQNANWDQVKADANGTDRTKRIEARKLVTAYREANDGKYPF